MSNQKLITATVNVFSYNFNETTLFIQALKDLTLEKKVLFACIGTDRATGDSLGPLVGTNLKRLGYDVIGTIEEPLHAQNLTERLNEVNQELKPDLVIAIDACLGDLERIGTISMENKSLKPGVGVKKELPSVGDISIMGIVNMSGFLELQVLQCTRLDTVMKMANSIVHMIWRAIPAPHSRLRRSNTSNTLSY